MDNEYYYNLDFLNIDIDTCINEWKNVETHSKPYENTESFANGTFFQYAETWQIVEIHKDEELLKKTPYINSISKKFEDMGLGKSRPRFRRQLANTSVPYHVDKQIGCAINVILSENRGPVTFEDIGDVEYRITLLNTTKNHMVREHDIDRILLKWPLFISFNEAKNILKLLEN